MNESEGGGMVTRFKSADCLSLNPSMIIVRYCGIKAYSRKTTALSIGVTHIKPLKKPINVSKQLK